ncbi:TPA: hypothetical protein ACXI73_000383 [Stenotrophomonas maltophilia]
MVSILGVLALGVMVLCICLPFAATAIQLFRLVWFLTGEKRERGKRPRFTGLVLAMLFSSLAATEILHVEPFLSLRYLNPVPPEHRDAFVIGMLVLALVAWISGGLPWKIARRRPEG